MIAPNVWFVWKHCEGKADEFCGVFDAKDKAEKVCVLPEQYLAPAVMNEDVTNERGPWPGSEWPNWPGSEPE
jgi:hypothetical protein